MDEHGLDVEDLKRRLAGGLRPKLVYSIPDHQNPAGVSLAAERRTLLVELAQRYGFLIVEDVAYRELPFYNSLPSLWSLAPDVVVQTGTMSKTFFPGVRLGWAVGPADISTRLVSAKQNTDQCAGALAAALRGIASPRLDRRALVLSRALYRRKSERMLAALERWMPEGAHWTRPEGGFFSWLTLPDGADSGELLGARLSEASASCRARCSSRMAAAPTSCASPSAWSANLRSTTGSSGSPRSWPRELIEGECARTTDDAPRAAPTTVSSRTRAPRRSRDCRSSAPRAPLR